MTSSSSLKDAPPEGRRLWLRPRRREEGKHSLFARLTSSAVDALHRDALRTKREYNDQEDYGWSIASSGKAATVVVDFLPLCVKFDADTTIYVSYNGGCATAMREDDGDGEILELPSCLIPNGFTESAATEVRVTALPSIQDANILSVEPLTCEDWELLESSSQFLEGGALLNQVSVVYSEQILPLWVGGKDTARIRVLPENFQPNTSDHDAWPAPAAMITTASYDDATTCCCLRLMHDTRVVVSPKPRRNNSNQSQSSSTSPPLRVFPTYQDYSQPANQFAESLGKKHISTLPGTVWVPSETKLTIPGFNHEDETALVLVWNVALGASWQEEEKESEKSSFSSCVLQIAFSDDVPQNHIAVHRLTRTRLDVIALVDSVVLRILSPIEVARGSVLDRHHHHHHHHQRQRQEVMLRKVELLEVRTSEKWRYPNNLNAEGGVNRILTTAQEEEEHRRDESPIEDGSFLFLAASTPDDSGHVLYQASFSEANEDSEGRSALTGCFVSQDEVQRLGGPRATVSTPIVSDATFQLRSTSHILNLLPEDSNAPTELTATKQSAGVGNAIVCGVAGSGKTHTALFLAAVQRFLSNTSTFYLDCKRLKDGRGIRMEDILYELNCVFYEAATCKGDSLIILDDLDELSPNLESGNNTDDIAQSHQVNPVAVDQSKLIGDSVRRHLEGEANIKSVSVIITVLDRHSISTSILEARPFTRVVETPNLTAPERDIILWKMITSGSETREKNAEDAFKALRIGRKTDMFRPRDLELLASRVRHRLENTELEITPETVADCTSKELESFTPLRQLSASDEGSGAAAWSDVGGLFHVKDVLTSTILHPAKYRRIYEKAKIRLPRGVLVFGSPGCGKSHLIPALAKKCGFSLVTCRGPELLDRYIGASESKVRELFARAAASSPSILFFDEIDALAPRRGSDRTGVTDRVVNQLLTLLDGVEDSNAKGLVYVVAATSRPDIIDPALLRPGRLEKHVYVGPPESDEEYTDLLLKIASRYSIDEDLLESISSGQFSREARSSCVSFDRLSCADFKAAFDTAQLSAIHELLESDQADENVSIRQRHITEALRAARPSLPERDHAMLMAVYKPFRKSLSEEQGDDSGPKPARELRTALR